MISRIKDVFPKKFIRDKRIKNRAIADPALTVIEI